MSATEARHFALGQQEGASHPRYHGLDLLKALAIIAIVMHHFQQDFDAHYAHLNFYDGRLYVGYVVELFFLVSGFVLAVSEAHRSQMAVIRPLLHRLRRLWPMAAISVVVMTALYPLYQHFAGISWFGRTVRLSTFLISLTTISQGGLFNTYSYNNPLWYVGVLILCYCAFYLLRRLAYIFHMPAWPFFAAMCLLGAYGYVANVEVPFLNMNSSARGYAAFFLGVLMYTGIPRLTRHAHVASGLAAAVALGAFGALWTSDAVLEHEWLVDTFVLWPALLVVCTVSPFVERLSNNRAVSFLGRINYEVYLWHGPVEITEATILAAFTLPVLTSRVALLAHVVICEAVGALFYYLVEKPLDRLLPQLGKK